MQYKTLLRLTAITTLVAIAGCATPPPPAPPPPPPVVVAPTPPIPVPPLYAAANLIIPPMGPDGRRITPNSGLDEIETLWHLRSALNVAALSCVTAEHLELTDNYNNFLKVHKRALDDANKAVEAKFRREQGADYRRIRDTHSTQVYNFFSLPPVKEEFCDVSLNIARQVVLTPSDQLIAFAYTGLGQIEGIFDRFFAEYDTYQRNLIAWNTRYAPQTSAYASSQNASPYGAAASPYGAAVNTTSLSYMPSAAAVPEEGNVQVTSLPASAPAGGGFAEPSGAIVQQLPGTSAPAGNGITVQQLPGASTPADNSVTVQQLPRTSAPAGNGVTVQQLPGVSSPAVQQLSGTSEPVGNGVTVQQLPGSAAPLSPTAPVPGFGSVPLQQSLSASDNAAGSDAADVSAKTDQTGADVWTTSNGDSVPPG